MNVDEANKNEHSVTAEKPVTIKKIELSDVKNATPVESIADTMLMESIEKANPIIVSSKKSSNDPDGSDFDPFDASFGIVENAQPQTSDIEDFRHDSSQGLVEDELFEFTKQINRAHFKDQVNRKGKIDLPGEIYQDNGDKAKCSVDTFAADVGNLFIRAAQKANLKRRNKTNRRSVHLSGIHDEEDQTMDHTRSFCYSDGDTSARTSTVTKAVDNVMDKTMERAHEFGEVLAVNRTRMHQFFKNAFLFSILPGTALACVFYYALGNPLADGTLAKVKDEFVHNSTFPNTTSAFPNPTSYTPDEIERIQNSATVSWWILFLFARQLITFGLSRGVGFLIITYCQRLSGDKGMIGPLARLFILQSRHLPLQIVLWCIIDFVVLQGKRPFVKQWLYYQPWITIFNDPKQAGNVLAREWYRDLLIFGIFAGVAVTTKRFLIGLHFGKSSYKRYSEDLSGVLKKTLLLTMLSQFAAKWKGQRQSNPQRIEDASEKIDSWLTRSTLMDEDDRLKSLERVNPKVLTVSQRAEIDQLLGEWEDSDIDAINREVKEPTLGSIVQFRSSCGILDSDYPFSHAFGQATNRLEVIDHSQNQLYKNLMRVQSSGIYSSGGNDAVLKFHTLAFFVMEEKYFLDKGMIQDLISIFRPARNGDITLLDFCKGIDEVYKQMRTLRAKISNEGKMNAAWEQFLNFVFYISLGLLGLSVVKVNTRTILGIVATALLFVGFLGKDVTGMFMKGLVFILVQRPYDIGDRILVSQLGVEMDPTEESGWIVKDISLYYTTFIYAATQECATCANGALFDMRVLNAARAEQCFVSFYIRFRKILSAEEMSAFSEKLNEIIKSKPREWVSLKAFRLTSVNPELGYATYFIWLQHKDTWQNFAALKASLANMQALAENLSYSMKLGALWRTRLSPYPMPSEPSEQN